MELRKEEALDNFLKLTEESWTWAKLTDEEQLIFTNTIKSPLFEVHGDYGQRWTVLNNYYQMFLLGCGYKPIGWRE